MSDDAIPASDPSQQPQDSGDAGLPTKPESSGTAPAAWTDLALNKKVPEAAPACDNPVDSLMALIEPIGIRATPTVIFENGQRGQGNMLASVLRERLARAETGGRQASAN